jgi:hypothetical protein
MAMLASAGEGFNLEEALQCELEPPAAPGEGGDGQPAG